MSTLNDGFEDFHCLFSELFSLVVNYDQLINWKWKLTYTQCKNSRNKLLSLITTKSYLDQRIWRGILSFRNITSKYNFTLFLYCFSHCLLTYGELEWSPSHIYQSANYSSPLLPSESFQNVQQSFPGFTHVAQTPTQSHRSLSLAHFNQE